MFLVASPRKALIETSAVHTLCTSTQSTARSDMEPAAIVVLIGIKQHGVQLVATELAERVIKLLSALSDCAIVMEQPLIGPLTEKATTSLIIA